MASNAQKTPLGRSLNRWAQQKIYDAIQQLGRALPCSVVSVSGSIVTVSFQLSSVYTLPNVTMPTAGWQYIRVPIQVGDAGMTVPADYYLGGVSGLGGGVADLSLPANLSALVFVPVANSGWSAPDDPNSVVIYGPDGCILRTTNKAGSLTLTTSGVAIKGNLTVTGSIAAGYGGGDPVGLQTHQHGQGSPAAGTSAPTAGT